MCRWVTAVGANGEKYLSQDSVATHFSCGGIFNDYFIANFLESVRVKKMKIG